MRTAFRMGIGVGLITFGLAISFTEASTQTSLSYDYLGRVIQVTQQGQTEDYFYSGEKRVFKKEASGKKRVYLYEDHSVVFDREVGFGKRGDADGNGLWTISDAVYVITYIFGGGPAPTPNLLAGDANGFGDVSISDAVYLIQFIFGGGPAPSSETLSLPGAGYVEAPGAGRLWSDGAMGGEDLWYVEDPVSSTSAVLAGNALIDVVHSTPFGEQLTTATLEKRYLFTSKELDATTGLFYYGARYYDPALGRFLQWDSVMDGPNRYLYVKNNPINANDPSGHEGELRPPALNLNPQDYMDSITLGSLGSQGATIGAQSYGSIMNQRMQRQAQVSLEPTGILSPVDQWAMEPFDGPESASRGDALLLMANFALPVMSEISAAAKSTRFSLSLIEDVFKRTESQFQGVKNSCLGRSLAMLDDVEKLGFRAHIYVGGLEGGQAHAGVYLFDQASGTRLVLNPGVGIQSPMAFRAEQIGRWGSKTTFQYFSRSNLPDLVWNNPQEIQVHYLFHGGEYHADVVRRFMHIDAWVKEMPLSDFMEKWGISKLEF